MKRILIAGGGTGGHIYPSLSVIQSLRKKSSEKVRIIYIGSGSELEKPLYEISDKSYTISSGKWKRYFAWSNFFSPLLISWGWFQSLMFILREMPDVVFSKGGYVSFPVVVAARFYAIPIIIHESDAIPGIANRILGKFAKKIAIGFPSAKEYFLEGKMVLTGNIARPDVTQGDPMRARKTFSFSESKPVILVLGGSQGSQSINTYIVEILAETLPFAQILHQTGQKNLEEVLHLAKEREGIKPYREGYHPIAFLDAEQMKDALSLADLVISRSGATSIAEIAACKKVSILIPLANSANNHQRFNAFALAKKGASVVLEESNLGVHVLFGKVKQLLFDTEVRESMKKQIEFFDYVNASDEVADLIMENYAKK